MNLTKQLTFFGLAFAFGFPAYSYSDGLTHCADLSGLYLKTTYRNQGTPVQSLVSIKQPTCQSVMLTERLVYEEKIASRNVLPFWKAQWHFLSGLPQVSGSDLIKPLNLHADWQAEFQNGHGCTDYGLRFISVSSFTDRYAFCGGTQQGIDIAPTVAGLDVSYSILNSLGKWESSPGFRVPGVYHPVTFDFRRISEKDVSKIPGALFDFNSIVRVDKKPDGSFLLSRQLLAGSLAHPKNACWLRPSDKGYSPNFDLYRTKNVSGEAKSIQIVHKGILDNLASGSSLYCRMTGDVLHDQSDQLIIFDLKWCSSNLPQYSDRIYCEGGNSPDLSDSHPIY